MARFRFTLAPVLSQRERVEDEKQQALAQRQRELRAAEAELARLNGEFKHYSLVLRDDHAKLSSEELRWHYAHLEYLDRCMTMQHGVIMQCRTAVDRARAELVGASKDRKVIEKLKARRFEEHQAAEALQEQKELDDANNRRQGSAARTASAEAPDRHPEPVEGR